MNRVEEILEYKKGRYRVLLEDGTSWILYKGEVRAYRLEPGAKVPEALAEEIRTEVIGKRAKKRAMHLLEQMDRTEYGLRGKLRQGEYQEEAIEDAIAYVKSYHYLDDERYARNYILSYQNTRSRQRIQQDLLRKGIDKRLIEQVLEEAYEGEELQMIRQLLQKKHYDTEADMKEKRRIYAFLLRRGFKSGDILQVMRCEDMNT